MLTGDYLPKSSLGIVPPRSRLKNGGLMSPYLWLEERKELDGAEGLWRIHNCLYDFTNFVNEHPGGSEWLFMTKGTDITEAFESHHISQLPEQLLKKYFVKKIYTNRNTPFTFEENGFYRTLKKEIRERLKVIPKESYNTSDMYSDVLLIAVFLFSTFSVRFWSYILAIIAGTLLGLLTTAAHNYIHKKNSFRMFYFQFAMFQVRDWRISHGLSHHLYTNTISDLEISMPEPFFKYHPIKKYPNSYHFVITAPLIWLFSFLGSFLKEDWRISHILSQHLYTNTIIDLEISMPEPFFQYHPIKKYLDSYHFVIKAPFIWLFSFYGSFLKEDWRISHVLSHHLYTNTIIDLEISMPEPFLQYHPIKKYFHGYHSVIMAPFIWLFSFHGSFLKDFRLKNRRLGLTGLILPSFMYIFGSETLLNTIFMWNIVLLAGSFEFSLIGLNAAHHHPDVFHDGDTPRSIEPYDWGLSQLDAVMDRKDITGSDFLVLTTFGDHCLHHLFPTLDHSILKHLYPTLEKVMRKFDLNLRMTTQWGAIIGGFQQMVKEKPNAFPPDLKNKKYLLI